MEPGIAAGTVNSPETIPFYGVRLSTLVSSFLFLPPLRELSDTNCVFLLPDPVVSFPEYGKYLYVCDPFVNFGDPKTGGSLRKAIVLFAFYLTTYV